MASLKSPALSNETDVEDVFVFPASFAQQRLWFSEQLFPGNTLYNIPLLFRLTGKLARSPLHQSIQTLVQRHETLRTTLDIIDGQLAQIVISQFPVPFPIVNLHHLPLEKREATALKQVCLEAQHPFNLAKGPLFRVHLWQLQETEHLLLIAFHHIIFDEWSSGVLIRELGELYTAFVDSKPNPLPNLVIQYADFAHWQREWLQGEFLNSQVNYWKQQLKDVPVLDLPGVPPRAVAQNQQGASQLLELPQELLNALEDLSQQAGVTLFMTLLAAFQTLLHRYSGQTDMAIGSPIANRHRQALEGLIGFLVNSLVLRTDLAGDPSFRELLHRVRDVTLAAYAHQDVPFEKLVEALQPVRNLGQNPLFRVVFALQNAPMEQLSLPGLVLSPVDLETKTARFDLELYLWKCSDNFRNLWGRGWQRSDGLRGLVVYNTELFDEAAIASLRQHFQTLLEGIVANPDAHLSELSLLTPDEQHTRLLDWQGNVSPYPADVGIHQLFEAQVRQQPEAIALQFGHQVFTYDALNQGSNQLARYLQRLGITTGVPVGICLERSAEAIAAMIAILKAGGAYVPLDPTYPAERLHFMVADAGIPVVLTHRNWADGFSGCGVRTVYLEQTWDAIAQESGENLSIPVTSDQLAYVIYTSGSTGTPKGVMVPHRAVNRLVCETNYVEIGVGDRIAQVANLAFDAATFEVWGALLNGAQLIGIDRETTLSPADFVATLQQQTISILFLTTALFNQTVNQIPLAFQSLKYLLFGGETVNVDCVRSVLQNGMPQHLLHVYGPTENTTFSTWYEVEAIPDHATTIPIGQAIAHTQTYVLDTHLKPIPPGIPGELYLGGNGLAQGYLNRPELTSERFVDFGFWILDFGVSAQSNDFGLVHESQNPKSKIQNPKSLYRTGDRVLYRPDGNLEFLGRTDHQVKLRGFRVELGEIEAAIAQHPTVQAVVVLLRDIEPEIMLEAAAERQLVAYLVPKDSQMPTERELRSFLKAKLPAYMVPAAFVVLDALPLTANGKVNHKALPLPLMVEASETHTPVAPTTSLETLLAELWSRLLGRKTVGIHDNFFELGGHSLLATQLISHIRDRLQVELPLRSVFETPTIAALAQKLEALQARDSSPKNNPPYHEEPPQ